MSSYLTLLHSRSIKRLSIQRPRPSCSRPPRPIHRVDEHRGGELRSWSGVGDRRLAPHPQRALQASTQNGIVLESRPQHVPAPPSITATKYINPSPIGHIRDVRTPKPDPAPSLPSPATDTDKSGGPPPADRPSWRNRLDSPSRAAASPPACD